MSGPAFMQGSLDRLQWGDHVCHLFASALDLGEILVPYFKTGLERNEACLWVTSAPYGTDRAVSEMRSAVPDFDRRIEAEQIQIVGYDEWYTKQGALDAVDTIRGWKARKDEALTSGYEGLRIAGNTSFLDAGTWNDFVDYERSLDLTLPGQRILTLCSYCRPKCSVDAIVEVMCAHGMSLTKRHGQWDLLDFRRPPPSSWRPDDPTGGERPPWISISAVLEGLSAHNVAGGPGRIEFEGAPVQLSRKQATKLAIALQELVANATRYGALSSPQGKINVQWRLSVNGLRRIYFKWIETGASNLIIAEKVGFGTRLMASLVDNYVRDYEPSGLTCTFELDLESASELG
jgi:hypothetical protein